MSLHDVIYACILIFTPVSRCSEVIISVCLPLELQAALCMRADWTKHWERHSPKMSKDFGLFYTHVCNGYIDPARSLFWIPPISIQFGPPRFRDNAKSNEIGICIDIEMKPAALFHRPKIFEAQGASSNAFFHNLCLPRCPSIGYPEIGQLKCVHQVESFHGVQTCDNDAKNVQLINPKWVMHCGVSRFLGFGLSADLVELIYDLPGARLKNWRSSTLNINFILDTLLIQQWYIGCISMHFQAVKLTPQRTIRGCPPARRKQSHLPASREGQQVPELEEIPVKRSPINRAYVNPSWKMHHTSSKSGSIHFGTRWSNVFTLGLEISMTTTREKKKTGRRITVCFFGWQAYNILMWVLDSNIRLWWFMLVFFHLPMQR